MSIDSSLIHNLAKFNSTVPSAPVDPRLAELGKYFTQLFHNANSTKAGPPKKGLARDVHDALQRQSVLQAHTRRLSRA